MGYTFFQKIQIALIKGMVKVHWRQTKPLSQAEIDDMKARFKKDYFVIATRKSNYLTTFFIALGNLFLTGRWGFYSHVLMNLEDTVESDSDFRFIEATGKGVHFSDFTSVFGAVDAVALIKPKNLTLEEWTSTLDRAKTYLGRPYDNLFDLKSDLEINCVELIRLALESIPDYSLKFKEFEKLVATKKKLTPDMFATCSDFEVVLTIRR